MKHTKSLLQTEIFRMQKAFDKLDKSGQNIALADYFLELIQDYEESLKILNERNSVAEAEKSCECEHEWILNPTSLYCDKCGEHQMLPA